MKAWLLSVVIFIVAAAHGAELQVEIAPKFPSGLAVTRLDFLMSDFAFRRPDGSWLELENWQEFISLTQARTRFTLTNLPAMKCSSVRFKVGLPNEINKKDPSEYAAGHPLNPVLNGLHWSWQGGYVFLALEGKWGAQQEKGFSFHLANAPQLMQVELPVAMLLGRDAWIHLELDVTKIFSGLALTDENSSTHSRDGDELARQLKTNVENAFSLRVKALPAWSPGFSRSPALIASNATPYQFRFSEMLPRPSLPLDNPLTEQGVALGRKLFNDARLSRKENQSCASCHDLRTAGAEQGKPLSIGTDATLGTRNSMPLFNLAWKRSFFWDGRARSLREQVLEPIQNPVEMHESLTNVVRRLETTEDRDLFRRAFGTDEINADRLARGLEQFLLTLTSDQSKCDRVMAGEETFSDEEARGFELFNTEYDPRREQSGADCFHCHGGPLFQSVAFANNGLDLRSEDSGRYRVTGKEGDRGKFAAPSLRNVVVTGPYMHDGRFETLEQVVAYYSEGVKRSATLDPNLAKHPDGGVHLSKEDQRALTAFLKTLTDERFVMR